MLLASNTRPVGLVFLYIPSTLVWLTEDDVVMVTVVKLAATPKIVHGRH